MWCGGGNGSGGGSGDGGGVSGGGGAWYVVVCGMWWCVVWWCVVCVFVCVCMRACEVSCVYIISDWLDVCFWQSMSCLKRDFPYKHSFSLR